MIKKPEYNFYVSYLGTSKKNDSGISDTIGSITMESNFKKITEGQIEAWCEIIRDKCAEQKRILGKVIILSIIKLDK